MASFFRVVVRMLRLGKSARAHSQCNSGPPKTHDSLVHADVKVLGRIARADRYTCKNAVDVVTLLRITRAELLASIQRRGGNVLVNESWTCTIFQSKSEYRVVVEYTGQAAKSSLNDPQAPVAIDEAAAACVGRLMTVSRKEKVTFTQRTSEEVMPMSP